MSFLSVLSSIFGWSYFLAWSLSFYPQVILNYKRKCVTGLSFDYLLYNIQGFLCYATYTVTNYTVQRQEHLTHSVQLNDVAFALHAVLLTCIIIYQCIIYERRGQTINHVHLTISIVLWALIAYNVCLGLGGVLPWYTDTDATYSFNVVEFLGYVKAFISFIKYVPQAYLNYKIKSTVGWSIGNVMLDFTGGSLSFAQQLIDAIDKDDWGVFSKDIPKLVLAVESIMFDIIFMCQHYIIYYKPPANGKTYAVSYASMVDDDDEHTAQLPPHSA